MSVGKTDDFLDACDHVIIRAFSSDPEEVLNFYEDELKAMNSKGLHTRLPQDNLLRLRLRRQKLLPRVEKWDAFLADMTQIINKSSQYQDFKGLVFQNYMRPRKNVGVRRHVSSRQRILDRGRRQLWH